MTAEPLVSQTIAPANNFLTAVKAYLDLVSGDGLLTPGSGLKRLYVMSAGVVTFNEKDIEEITQQAEELKILPGNVRGFMHQSILKNMFLYGQELHRIIAERLVSISNGDIQNPTSFLTFNADEARRYFYVPPVHFLLHLKKALYEDTGFHYWQDTMGVDLRKSLSPLVNTLENVAGEADLLLTQLQSQEGFASPNETAWAALMELVERLVQVLKSEAQYPGLEAKYKLRARPALRILWVITKLLMGDLTTSPQRRDTNLIDLDQTLTMTDGTLAAIPFPLRETVKLFTDPEASGISMKARKYLSAVSAAAFYRAKLDSDYE